MRATISSTVLVLLSALAVLVVPFFTEAQPAGKVPRIGVIGEGSAGDPWVAAFRQGLRDLGYAEGENILVEYRYLQGVLDRVPDLPAELIRLKVDVLVVGGTIAARSARAQTTRVPIVFTLVSDPVGSGLVTSLARPGGNATGLSNVISELSGKQLELLKAAVPQVARVAVLYNPANPAARSAVTGAREAARALAMELQVLEVRQRHELATALSPLTSRRVDAILAISDPAIGGSELAPLVVKHRLPAITAPREFAERGGLLAYGPSYSHNWLRAATYVDKILKGAKPADLPVEQPTKFELVVNLKTAKALGLSIPQSLLWQADEVIQ
jgi:putative ABC transport system substrate-binding protein